MKSNKKVTLTTNKYGTEVTLTKKRTKNTFQLARVSGVFN